VSYFDSIIKPYRRAISGILSNPHISRLPSESVIRLRGGESFDAASFDVQITR